jgi:hypothetical protein
MVNGKSKKITDEYIYLNEDERNNALNSPEIARDGIVNLKYDIWYFFIDVLFPYKICVYLFD